MMIIDCHGHYTTAPEPHQEFRQQQLAHYEDASLPAPTAVRISDDQMKALPMTRHEALPRWNYTIQPA